MSTISTDHPAMVPSRTPWGRVAAWASWDWGSAAFNAVITTFVFATYLADSVAVNGAPEGAPSGQTWLGISTAITGVIVALLAPVLGHRADAGGHRKRNLAIWTALTIACMALMFLVKDNYSYLLLGLVLLGAANVFSEIAGVSYNAMVTQVSTPATVGRVSGFGWGAGYVGGIFLLLILYVGVIAPEVGWFGVTSDEGLRYRLVALLAAGWFALFALPLFLAVPERRATAQVADKVGIIESYRILFRDIARLWRTDRNAVHFLIASAFFRDGLSAVFTFGAVLAVTVFGIAPEQVLIFGVAANVVAAAGAFLGGLLEDKVGPKVIIMISLIGLITTAAILLFVHSTSVFWVLGLALCLWVGPAQASARSFLAQVAPKGHEGQMFGLYTTSGRAVSFLAPALVAVFSSLGGDRLGIVGIIVVLVVGTVALIRVRPPQQ